MAGFFKKSKPVNTTTGQRVTASPTVDHIRADRIQLSWKLEPDLADDEYVEVFLKDITNKSRWKLAADDTIKKWSFTITELKPDTEYSFKVRVVNENDEGDFSPESKTIKTKISAAKQMREMSENIPSEQIQKYRIPVKEVKEARDETLKTRRFEIGTRPKINVGEKTIVLVGATGSGKSTLVDGMVNFIFGVNFNDDFRFTLIRLEGLELGHQENQAVSQTDWITCYTIYPSGSGRIPFTLNIIDTPGFGDTRGFERDEELINQIRYLFSKEPPRGVTIIDAVCFLVKSPDARLTAVQKYIFQQIMSLFGKDIEKNICTLITFADGEEPPVLHALKTSNVPFGQDFRFNNSALFAGNRSASSSGFSSMFWNLGLNSFKHFFAFLTTLTPRSLEMTKSVLQHRNELETTKRNLMPLVDLGLSKMNEIEQQIKKIEENKSQIRANKDFEIKVKTKRPVHKDLPPNKHTTNCRNCNLTCHESCIYGNDEDKAKCSAMGSDGNCTHCSKKCHWSKHTNSPYIVTNEYVTEIQTVEEMKQKYKTATGELPTLENIIQIKREEFEINTKVVNKMLETIHLCNNTLEEIALRPSPLSATEYIDALIKCEELDKEIGYTERVQSLKEIRKRANIDSKATQLTLSAEMTFLEVEQIKEYREMYGSTLF
ncbi:hypothetical protein MAR_031058 [Mya arenaria]|uniref:Fibronectin type-III domain-containing protein n=1 Tax=Mya arenaria TaxID=6604 RepID=A0ABY7F5L3_MYAAR|nr:uncharacterized protein LOC128205577 [Mya arenaria]WAR16464.1 hypothetical protein MAR_031058 [Mya arenaria]